MSVLFVGVDWFRCVLKTTGDLRHFVQAVR